MRTLLFLDYWSLNEPLTQATVLPTLRMVLDEGLADRIVLVTVERSTAPAGPPMTHMAGVVHVPLHATRFPVRPIARAMDLLRMVPRIAAIVREQKVDAIMARGVVAGGFARSVHQRTGIPYAVDYFEPHAEYMADVGEWSRQGLLYRALNRSIAAQWRSAVRCISVTRNFQRMCIAAGAVPDRLLVAPCPVDAERMVYNAADRTRLRSALGWQDAIVGVYAGKFGGLYHRERSFAAFAAAQRIVGAGFGLIILTSEPEEQVREGLAAAGFAGDRSLVRYARHEEVPAHLSAADFAFAPYRGTPSSACISPMKIGEYWANGLPVLLTRGVGDDSAIIADEPLAGALFDPEGDDITTALPRILEVLNVPDQRERTSALAVKYRSMALTMNAYRETFAMFER